jgi:hypothetical protein
MTRNYQQIVEALEMFASAHPNVQRFKSSFFDQINVFTSSDNTWPIMYATPQDVTYNQNTNVYRFRIYCLDMLLQDRSNQPYILLATSEILRDLVNWIRDPKNPLDIINNPSIVTVNNFGTDGSIGWYMDLVVSAPAITTDCSLPFPGLEVSGLTCDYTYVTDFITCDDLSECPIIIDLQEQIDAIIISADTFTVNGSYDNSIGTLFLVRNDGELIPITGFTTGSTGPDIYVTGGTFNPSTETLTLTRNDNQPVIVTGFTQTDISGLVPYTGGIDNVTLDEFSFIVNTNQNQFGFIINDLTTKQQLVEIGQNGSGNGVINVWNKQNNLVTTIENGQITTPTISATTYLNLPLDIRVTGGTYNAGTSSILFTNNTGGTFTVTGITTSGGAYLPLSGGTVTGLLGATDGFDFTANGNDVTQIVRSGNADLLLSHTGSGDIVISSSGSGTILQDGTEFQEDISVPDEAYGPSWNNSLEVPTKNAIYDKIQSLTDIRVTGGTYNNGTGIATFTNNTGGTFNVTGFTSGGGGGGNSIGELTGDVTAGPASSSSQSVVATLNPNLKTGAFGVTVDGVSSTVQVGQTGFVTMPYSGTITSWSISANAVGSIQFDIWKAAGAIPTIANTIVASAFPTLTANQYISSSTTTGWSLTFNAGDVFGFYVNSATTIKNATLTLQCTKL